LLGVCKCWYFNNLPSRSIAWWEIVPFGTKRDYLKIELRRASARRISPGLCCSSFLLDLIGWVVVGDNGAVPIVHGGLKMKQAHFQSSHRRFQSVYRALGREFAELNLAVPDIRPAFSFVRRAVLVCMKPALM
jgi:hypothetical protein